MNSKQQPDWWRYSATSWQQLFELLSELEPTTVDQCANQASWQLLGAGDTNTNFKLSLAHQDYFVQLVDQAKLEQLPSGEYASQTRLVSENPSLSKWIPKCLLDTEVIRVSIWLDARPTINEDFNNLDLIAELSRLLSELHHSELSLPELDMKKHLAKYYEIARANKNADPLRLETLYKQGQTLTGYFVASHSCHNDISPGNLLSGHQLFLVDWEYAAISDPLFELAGIVVNYNLSDQQEQELVTEYQNQSGIKIDIDKLEAMKDLYRIISELWYMENEQSCKN
ncbi:MAG: aminoglycoside phosphotransferase [Rickettsiales bacterium]|jgi:thiamine kinase|nr:aminoglycoside phosphotransferase [Rickettsiales bacterium]